ncbi:hypothetical protein [Sediminibacterium ginsengisoli]|uniref:YD repeat-containing protein n=1 Tax=Sediminibacterium ginsengisoli TaxID=413434 RepID=A0A1T4R310_9BACT|nr:hypothetical protein [Sediminibacterium ginsengisoli]SKA10237.1 hypothetical protein SAMN04488132_11091 [Sediminibacterium ginsengisoli]
MKRLVTNWPLAVVMLLLAGCSKNNNPAPVPADSQGTRVARIDHSAVYYDSLYYNAGGQIIRIKRFSTNPSPEPAYDIEYNANGTVKQVLQNNGARLVYQYMGQPKPMVVSHFNQAGIKLDYVLYDYDAQGRLHIAETMESIDPSGQAFTYGTQTVYHYRTDGNLDREEISKWTGQRYDPDVVITYDNYDQGNNIDSIGHYLYLGFQRLTKNNPGKRTVTSNGTSVEWQYTYQFNTGFMPVEKKERYTILGQPYESLIRYHYY